MPFDAEDPGWCQGPHECNMLKVPTIVHPGDLPHFCECGHPLIYADPLTILVPHPQYGDTEGFAVCKTEEEADHFAKMHNKKCRVSRYGSLLPFTREFDRDNGTTWVAKGWSHSASSMFGTGTHCAMHVIYLTPKPKEA